MTHSLTYIGANPAIVGVVPLPEGWPAANHAVHDADEFMEKIESGLYRVWQPADGDAPDYDGTSSETSQEPRQPVDGADTVDSLDREE